MSKISLPDYGRFIAPTNGSGGRQRRVDGGYLLQSWRQLKWKRKRMKCGRAFTCHWLGWAGLAASSSSFSLSRSLSTGLSTCRPGQHWASLLLASWLPLCPAACLTFLRLFALKILFIAITRICTKMCCNEPFWPYALGWAGRMAVAALSRTEWADNEIAVTQFGVCQKKHRKERVIPDMTNDQMLNDKLQKPAA